MHTFLICLIAAGAMGLQDLISVPLTQAEARNRAHLSAILDTVGWLVAITTTFVSVDTLAGHDFIAKVLVVALVSTANYFGTYWGTKLGKRFVKDEASLTVRVADLEAFTKIGKEKI